MKRNRVVCGIAVLALALLCLAPLIRATEHPAVSVNSDAIGEPFDSDARVSLNLPLPTNENVVMAAESPAEADEADKLAKQLSNPISSLISVPFQANEDWGYGPSGNGYKFTLNIQPVIPISISRDWTLSRGQTKA